MHPTAAKKPRPLAKPGFFEEFSGLILLRRLRRFRRGRWSWSRRGRSLRRLRGGVASGVGVFLERLGGFVGLFLDGICLRVGFLFDHLGFLLGAFLDRVGFFFGGVFYFVRFFLEGLGRLVRGFFNGLFLARHEAKRGSSDDGEEGFHFHGIFLVFGFV